MNEPPPNPNPQIVTLKMDSQPSPPPSSTTAKATTSNTNPILLVPSGSTNTQTGTVTLLNTALNTADTIKPQPTKSFVSSSPASKKIIINNNSLNLVTKPASAVLSNSKIFTINTQNTNLAGNSNLINSVNASSVPAGIKTNKIQYVKIVNPTSSNATQSTSIQPQIVQATASNKPIKITTISANTNTNAITTTTTNSENVPSIVQEDSQGKNLQTVSLGGAQESSALLNAVTNNGQRPGTQPGVSPNANSSVKLTTFQIVNTNNKPTTTTTAGAPVIQRIQSVNLVNNHPITKTIAGNPSPSQNPTSNFKVLNQQLPALSQPVNSQVNIKPVSSLSINQPSSQYTITKTVPAPGTSETGKQIITTIRNDSNPAGTTLIKKQHQLTTISSMSSSNASNNSQLNIFPLKQTSASPLAVLTTNATTSEQAAVYNSPIKSHSPNPNLVRLNNNNATASNISPNTTTTATAAPSNGSTGNARKPCNCTKSMCLKLYCDCFAMGSFCYDCNCVNCFNTLEHEDERNKAIKMVLDRNPQAFQSKIGKYTPQINSASKSSISTPTKHEEALKPMASEEADEIQSRHIKGCNCKKSNCLKRYCECYLAKIQCSALCKCIGCKNCDESTKTLLQQTNATDMRKQQPQTKQNIQLQQTNNPVQSQFSRHQNANALFTNNGNGLNLLWQRTKSGLNEGSVLNGSSTNTDVERSGFDQMKIEMQESLRQEYLMALSDESVGTMCQRLIDSVSMELDRLKSQTVKDKDLTDQSENIEIYEEDDEDEHYNEQMEGLIIEEFGRCLVNIIDVVEKKN